MANVAVLAQNHDSARVQNVDIATTPFPLVTEGWMLSAARTTSGTSDTIKGVANFTSATVEINVTTVTGTTPTLNVYIQQLLSDQTNWMDIAASSQIVAASKIEIGLASGGNSVGAVTDGSLTAGTTVTIPFAEAWRIKYTIGGTNPSFTFVLSATFIE